MPKENHSLFKIGTADKRQVEFIVDGKIDTEVLGEILDAIKSDAVRSNKGNTAAGRRFRLNTAALEKCFVEMRRVSPKSKKTTD